ncbi:MAG: aryl-sulfate sulfotransferase [Thomasclavelia sp.]|uniref:aryl-sulfate sulfotransferase n=1 Tax=Thomasclavelia sp. TaxID=3025757 RepID=UPI00399FBCD6
MKKVKNLFFGLLIFSLVAICFIIDKPLDTKASSDDKNSLPYTQLKNTSTDVKKIYNENYQNQIYQQIEKYKIMNKYTSDNPLLIENPFGTNTTGIYVYFITETDCKVSYTISCKGYEDFSRTLNTNTTSGFTKEHEYLLIGAIPGAKNTITLHINNKNNQEIDSISWSYQAPKLQGGNEYVTVDTTTYDTTSPLSNGLYTVLGNDVTEESDVLAYMRLYDNNGIIRSEIPIISYRSHRLLFKDNTMYMSVSSTLIVGIDQIGYVSKFYDTGSYKLHHDYIFDDNNNLIVLASEKNAETSEDKIIMIDHESGEVSELVDLIELFPNYYKTTTLPKNAEDLDWMHINSLELVNNDSLIISSRETSTIIKLNDIYKNVKIDYMIGSNNFWQDSGYSDLLLTKIGDFSMQAGQHCVTYQEDDSLENGIYYLYLYNNNLATSSTQPDYNWQEDDNYQNAYFNLKKGTSYYYKYLINENNRTVELVNAIPVDYSGYVSSVQELENNIIIDSGMAMTWGEYDNYGTLIKKFTTTGGKFIYRVFKYDYNDYWFQ